jgi:hypothetical protein
LHCVVSVLQRDSAPRARGPGFVGVMAGPGEAAPLYSRAMSEEAKLDDLAHRYLELWQDQMSALAADPEFAEALGRLFKAMGLTGAEGGTDAGGLAGAAAAWAAWPAMIGGAAAALEGQAGNGAGAEPSGGGRTAGGKTAARPAAPAAASEPGDARLAQLEERLAALQDRVAALERRTRRSRPRPSTRPGRERD